MLCYDKHAALWKVMVFVFTLPSYRQSQVGCEFKINSETLVENLKTQSICSQHFVCFYQIYEIEIYHSLVIRIQECMQELQSFTRRSPEISIKQQGKKKKSVFVMKLKALREGRWKCYYALNKSIFNLFSDIIYIYKI